MIARIDNHVEQGLARLISQYKDAVQFRKWISVYLRQVQLLEDGIWEVIYGRNIDSGIGVQLDNIGKILNRLRGGLGDDDYRIALRAEVAILRSTGDADDLYAVASLSMPSGYTFNIIDLGNAALMFVVNEPIAFAVLVLFQNLIRAKQGGVKLLFEFTTVPLAETFTWTTGPGWGSVSDATVGGKLACVL